MKGVKTKKKFLIQISGDGRIGPFEGPSSYLRLCRRSLI